MPRDCLHLAKALRSDRRGVIAMEYAVLAAIVLAAVMLAFPVYMDFMTARINAFVALI